MPTQPGHGRGRVKWPIDPPPGLPPSIIPENHFVVSGDQFDGGIVWDFSLPDFSPNHSGIFNRSIR